MRGNSASCYVETPRLGGLGVENDAKTSYGNSFPAGQLQKHPTKSLLN